MLIGEDPRDTARLWERMYNGSRDHFALSRGRVFPILGRRGITVAAIGGIDMALWDILGKSLNAPVWRLLGGRKAARMPPKAVRATKRVLRQGADLPLDAALALENREFLLLFDTADKTEGMRAFLDKRKPDFQGR